MKGVKNLSDEELVRLVYTQDQELYKEIVRRYQNKFMRYATYLIQDENKAADIVQEAFVKAFVNLRSFNTKKRFSSWIYRIVHNEAINHIKKYKREIPLADSTAVEQVAANGPHVEKDSDKQQLKKMVNFCLDKLPLIYRSPLVLSYLEGKSYEEISDILRIPIGTVGTRINRGKKLLAAICRQKGLEAYAKG